MKKKTISKKLILGKKTISNLNRMDLMLVNGRGTGVGICLWTLNRTMCGTCPEVTCGGNTCNFTCNCETWCSECYTYKRTC